MINEICTIFLYILYLYYFLTSGIICNIITLGIWFVAFWLLHISMQPSPQTICKICPLFQKVALCSQFAPLSTSEELFSNPLANFYYLRCSQTSYNYNHVLCALLRQASFTQHNIFLDIFLCCTMCLWFVPFNWWRVLYYYTILYPVSCW